MAANPKSGGATTAQTDLNGQLAAWVAHHQQVARSSLVSLLQNWMTSLMTWMVIGIALALPTLLYLVLLNVAEISGDWDGKPRISVYMQQDVAERDAREFARQLERRGDVTSTRFISAEQALNEFQQVSGFGDVLNTLDKNPLPSVIEIRPAGRDMGQLRVQISNLEANELVDSVVFDLDWIERLFAMLEFAQRLVTALGIVLAMGVLLIIGNTIRLAIENRRAEIEVIKLVGGTDRFVRRPFLYLGFWYGLGGAILAWFLVEGSLLFLAAPVEILAQSYRDDFALSGLGGMDTLIILAMGSLLGICGAVVAVGRHLSDIQPS